MAIQLARRYHVDRGEPQRWQVISPAQAYHGPTMATLALTGRPGLQRPFEPYLPRHPHIPPSTWRFDPTGQQALDALDRALEAAGPETVSAYFCEPISAAALPAYTPPERFWQGLDERRARHGFLIVFDEIVTGMGRTGHWFATQSLPLVPGLAEVHARAHLGWRATLLRGWPGRYQCPSDGRLGRSCPRAWAPTPRSACRGAAGHTDGQGCSRSRVFDRRRVR